MACSCDNSCELEALKKSQSKTLIAVMWINIILFIVEVSIGLWSHSTALLADSLDNLGDSLTYGLSLYAVYRGARAKAMVSLFKGGLILIAALFVLAQVIAKTMTPVVPVSSAMMIMSVVAFCTNAYVLYLLTRHKNDDINMNSVWHCSRNDLASNSSVLVAGIAVWFTQSAVPDILIGLALSLLLLWSASTVLLRSFRALKTADDTELTEAEPITPATTNQQKPAETLVTLTPLKK